MQIDAILFDCDRDHADISAVTFTRAAVELPPVPRANDGMVVQSSMRERSSAMGTIPVQCIDVARYIADDKRSAISTHFGHATRRYFGKPPDANRYHKTYRTMRNLLLITVAMLLAGCGREQKKLVGVVPKGANHIFWQTVHAGALNAAKEYGLEVEWNAPTLEIDSSRQIAIVESMVNRRLAGIALAPVDRKALVTIVERAHAAGIPVSIFDSDIDTEQRITYVATDNRQGGRMAARKLAELLLEEGEVAIISFMPGSAATMEREEGFREEMTRRYPKIKIVQTAFGMADRAKARAATENILAAHPNLRGLFADNESSSAGAVLALKNRANTKVRMVAFDSNDQLVADLRDRNIDALVIQRPFVMGYESVKAIGRKLQGQKVVSRIDLSALLITRADLQRPDVIELLHPDLSTLMNAK